MASELYLNKDIKILNYIWQLSESKHNAKPCFFPNSDWTIITHNIKIYSKHSNKNLKIKVFK